METHDLSISLPILKATVEAAGLGNVDAPTCEYYWLAFESLDLPSDAEQQACSFLTRICAMRLLDNSPDSTFGLSGTSWTENEFTEQQLEIMRELTEIVYDPELRARICDIVWTRLRIPEFARAASKAYIDSAQKIAIGGHVGTGLRISRGIRLALMVDKLGELPNELVKRAQLLCKMPELGEFIIAETIEHILPIGAGDSELLIEVCEQRANATQNPRAAQRLFDLAFRIAQRTKDAAASARLLFLLAKSYENEADSAPMGVMAAHSLKLAIHTLRRGPNTTAERDRLHAKLLRFQGDLPSEFLPVNVGSIDLTENVELARKRLRGKEKIPALAELILATQIQDTKRWRDNARKSIHDFPLQNLFAAEKFGSTYKTATAIPATGMNDDIPEERLLYSMLTEYNCLVGIVAHGSIQPILDALNFSHHITMADLRWFVSQSPYIPWGRHEFFCSGLMAGLQGRFLEGLHVLIPQIEHMIRVLLAEKEVVVSGLDQNGFQREYDLNKLLEMPETLELLAEDIVMSMKLLFVHRAGPNLRNELCHGMLNAGQFCTPFAVYAWWLALWLPLHPVAAAIRKDSNL